MLNSTDSTAMLTAISPRLSSCVVLVPNPIPSIRFKRSFKSSILLFMVAEAASIRSLRLVVAVVMRMPCVSICFVVADSLLAMARAEEAFCYSTASFAAWSAASTATLLSRLV